MADATSSITPAAPTTGFWVIGVIALLWNLLGVAAYLMQVTMSDEVLAAMPAAERALYENLPAWVTAAFALSVFAGALGCVLLLLRKRWAVPVFIVSLVAVVVQLIHGFLMSNNVEVYGPASAIMPVLVLLIAGYLVWHSRRGVANGLLV